MLTHKRYAFGSKLHILMESHIVKEFQNLRVFSNSKLVRMDDLVHDLATALEETARSTKSHARENIPMGTSSKRPFKKRKGRKRRTLIADGGNISEASESSIEEALKDYMESVALQSDSDDISISERVKRLTMPLGSNYIPSVESDSVTETFSPIRPQRRRKKYKSMAVDDIDSTVMHPPIAVLSHRFYKNHVKSMETLSGPSNSAVSNIEAVAGPSTSKDFTSTLSDTPVKPGKRKRSSKSRSEVMPSESSLNRFHYKNDNTMDTGSQESSTSSLSSSESDGLITNDESREADDEQSDFFHEPGPACGIPGIIPWWEDQGSPEGESEKEFQQILTGTFEHLSKASQLAFKARVSKLMAKSGREIRFGRRKLKSKEPGYSVSRFLKDRQVWNAMQGVMSPAWQSSNGSNTCNDTKRRRKAQHPTNLDEGYIGDEAEPIPESNIGNRMLQSMGWSPGSGLGAEGSGIKTPVMAYRRPRRQGLGIASSSNKTSDNS